MKKERSWLITLALPLALLLLLGLGACSGSDGKDADSAVTDSLQQQIAELEAKLESTSDPAVIADLEKRIEDLEAKLDDDASVTVKTDYVGAKVCAMCHSEAHDEWKTSWHTRKSTWGPAATEEAVASVYNSNKTHAQHVAAAQAKFLPGVIAMWDELSSHMILDRASLADVPDAVKATWPAGVTSVNYVTKKQYDWTEVEAIIGEIRKQRYAVYYDGGPVAEALFSYSTNGGIGWTVDTAMDPVAFAGNWERAGYKFLTIELDAYKSSDAAGFEKSNMYGTWRSWQEQCIACHTTGFDPDSWKNAKAAYVASEGTEGDLRGVYISEIEISCEACHGPGREHAETFGAKDKIINPAALAMSDPTRKMVCEQCHTRATTNVLYGAGANDSRGFVLGEHDFMDVMEYTRPAWGTGNRQVSIDGKGRRDHQQDMDLRLSYYAKDGNAFYHHKQACFDCHNAHGVGGKVWDNTAGDWVEYDTSIVDKTIFSTTSGSNPDPDGRVRLKNTRENMCGMCHGNWEDYLDIFNGARGWDPYSYSNWGSEGGRTWRRQHIFNTDDYDHVDFPLGRSFGLAPEQYTWGQLANGTWVAIWPWETVLPKYVNYVEQATKP